MIIEILILICLYVYLMIPYPYSSSNPLDELNTGDLIFFSGKSMSESVIKLVTFYEFSHVGMIVKDDGETYIWEADIGQGRKEGPRLIKLLDKLEAWKKRGYLTMGVRKRLSSLGTSDIIPSIKEVFDWEMSFSPWIFSHEETSKGKIFCSSLVAKTLNDIGDDIGNPYYHTPATLSKIEGYSNMEYFEIR
jgi:hypothetical protein